MAYIQKHRLCSFLSPVGEEKLLLQRMVAEESISRLFEVSLDLVSEDAGVSPDAVLGKKGSVRIELADGKERFLHGIVAEFVQGGKQGRFTSYHAKLRPWFWFLTRRANCRIFQNKTVPQIAEEVFAQAGFQDYELKLTASYNPRVFCVQYRETDYNFLARLFEEEGIFFFFKHEKNNHKLVLADPGSSLGDCPHQAEAFYQGTDTEMRERDEIRTWEYRRELHTGRYALKDYNFEDPRNPLRVQEATVTSVGGNDRFEAYDYHPEEFGSVGDGNGICKKRMQELETAAVRIHGDSDCRAFVTGHRFKLKGHFNKDQSEQLYVLVSIAHVLNQPAPFETGSDEPPSTYENSFTCIPASEAFRPPRITPKPLIQGPQTAVVVGPSGEEIYVDEYGRIKVQFHWDREGKKDENSSCWVRVSQMWAGKRWGAIAHPRINDEVIVEFLEADPDKPLVTGCVYNKQQMPPYSLPDNKTQTGIKSRSSKGGSPDNFNELRFEDEKGKEQVYVQAEKDKKVLVKNDNSENIGHDEDVTVGNDRKKKVGKNEQTKVGINRTESVGANETVKVGANRTIVVGGNQTGSVDMNKTETVKLACAESIGLAKALSIGAGYQVSVGAAMNESVVGFKAEEVGAYRAEVVKGKKTASIGEEFEITVDKKYALEAKDEIELKSGSSSVTMKKDGKIEISGTDVTFKTAAGKIHIDAGGIITIKGSMVKLNT